MAYIRLVLSAFARSCWRKTPPKTDQIARLGGRISFPELSTVPRDLSRRTVTLSVKSGDLRTKWVESSGLHSRPSFRYSNRISRIESRSRIIFFRQTCNVMEIKLISDILSQHFLWENYTDSRETNLLADTGSDFDSRHLFLVWQIRSNVTIIEASPEVRKIAWTIFCEKKIEKPFCGLYPHRDFKVIREVMGSRVVNN